MQATKVICPLCRSHLKVMQALPARVKCPKCGVKSIITEPISSRTKTPPPISHPAVVPAPPGLPPPLAALPPPAALPPSRAADFQFDASATYLPAASPRTSPALILGLLLALVLLAGAAAAAIWWFQPGDSPGVAERELDKLPKPTRPLEATGAASATRPKVEEPLPPKVPPPPHPPRPDPEPLPPEFVPVRDPNAPREPEKPGPEHFIDQEMFGKVSPELQERINKAIDKGVTYLKTNDSMVKSARGGRGGSTGYIALAGLTLLECGVPSDDPVVADLLASVRNAEPKIQETYSASLAILFLDRNGDPQDRERIRSLAARLMAGQNARGGWTYTLPAISTDDREQLLKALPRLPQPKLTAKPQGPSPAIEPKKPGEGPPTTGNNPAAMPADAPRPIRAEDLPKTLRDLPVVRYKLGDKIEARTNFPGDDDNSNTQFAILALWVARRHDVPVERTFAMVNQRFRGSQTSEGTWAYKYTGGQWKDTGTCAGLIGLGACRGIGIGIDDPKVKADSDPAMEQAVAFLAGRLKDLDRRGNRARPGGKFGGSTIDADAHGDLYFLWSLERVAVAYHLKAFGDREWYPWGAEILVEAQSENGSWNDRFRGLADTCFALLFLKKANIAKDLTTELKKINLPLTIRPDAPPTDRKE